MPLIRLSNVSKFYYSKGVIATGFSRVSLEFSMGEFVAITGESGSGKSTLLNVISGLDTYEEGEMYIDGKETSHYTEKDFEDYRRKYIGNIFQNFNLVNSYTVYQNIELVLLLNGVKAAEAKPRVNELIEKVGLTEYRNTKASKLSGGQKQRVAVARALAKDTPMIVADEPTGNLDRKAAEEIIQLLAEVAKEKLVIIVTHNIEQVEPFITRKIKMHDGKILEDVVLKQREEPKALPTGSYSNMRPALQWRVGIRNAFKIKAKFLLLLLVFLFVFTALTAELTAFRSMEASMEEGYNYYFSDLTPTRIVVKKGDGTAFSKEELETLSSMQNVKEVVENDYALDTSLDLYSKDQRYYYRMQPRPLSDFDAKDVKLTYGTMPEKETDLLIVVPKGGYFADTYKEVVGKTEMLSDIGSETYRVTGVLLKDNDAGNTATDAEGVVYMSKAGMERFRAYANSRYAAYSYVFNGKTYTDSGEAGWHLVSLASVKPGTCIMSEASNAYAKNGKSIGSDFEIHVKTPYYTDSLKVKCSANYNEKSFKKLTGRPSEEYDPTAVYVNPGDLNSLFDKPSYQISVFAAEEDNVKALNQALQSNGYVTLPIQDTLYTGEGSTVVKILTVLVTLSVAVVLFFVCYFVVRIIMRSRNIYYSTVRMLGGNKKICRNLLCIDLLTVTNVAAAVCAAIWILLTRVLSFPEESFLYSLRDLMNAPEFLFLYLIGIVISLLVSLRYAKNLFEKSSISTLHEEV